MPDPEARVPVYAYTNPRPAEWPQADYIVGNPPFIGKKEQSKGQKADLEPLTAKIKGAGVLDYVTGWYFKAAAYIQANQAVRAALVSTNSICQGEQVGILWSDLLARGVSIHFGHRTFQWTNEARGNAAVHCVIVGFGLHDVPEKWVFEYETPKSERLILPWAEKPMRAAVLPMLTDAAELNRMLPTRPAVAVPPAAAASVAD